MKRILYLKYILSQQDESLVKNVLLAMQESEVKGDWSTMVKNYMKDLDISEYTLISSSTKQLKVKLKYNAKIQALKELNEEKDKMSKIRQIEKSDLRMADYLAPNNMIINVREKQEIFHHKSRMTEIKINFPGKHSDLNCRLGCGKVENYEHIEECPILGKEKRKINLQTLWNGNLKDIKEC